MADLQPSKPDAKGHAGYDPKLPIYYDRKDLAPELDRVFGICHSCRLCFNLCGSFPALFEAIDRRPPREDARSFAEHVDHLTAGDRDRVLDECFQCKMCHVKCPYTPPHEWQVDLPRLMLRAVATRAKERGIPLRTRLLGDPDLLGRVGTATWPVSNAMNEVRAHRIALEAVGGIHRDKKLPPFAEQTFEAWWREHDVARPAAPAARGGQKPPPRARAALFFTCYVNWNDPGIGQAAVRVLERNEVDTVCPPQRCCGMPLLDQGDVPGFLERAEQNVRDLLPAVEDGRAIVVPQPTCGYVLRNEVPSMLGTEAARRVGAATRDICEFLVEMNAQGKLDKTFPPETGLGAVSYHLPCHLQAQNIGYKSRDLLRLIPKTRVVMNERCTAHDGTWAMKKEHFDDSMRIGKKSFDEVEDASPSAVASDCPLAAIQLEQGTGRKTWHPIELLDAAYRGVRLESKAAPGARYVPPEKQVGDWRERMKDVKEISAEDVERFERGERQP